LAEYCSQDNSTEGEMVLRDAVINGRVPRISEMEGFDHLDEPYLAYKVSQAVFEYMEKRFGPETPAKFLHYYASELGTAGVFKKILNMSQEDFERDFMFQMSKKYWAQVQGREKYEKYGPRLTNAKSQNPVYYQGAEFSPDGSKIAFISTEEGHPAVYIMRQDGKDREKKFTGFDGVSMSGHPLCWDTDGNNIYFAAKEKGRRRIYRGDVRTGAVEIVGTGGPENIYSPAISPDGKYLAFTGADRGFTDIYVHELGTTKTVNVTSNVFGNNYPAWSPSGTRLVFTEERGERWRVAVFDVKTGEKKFLTGPAEHNYSFTKFRSEREIVCTSDKNGIYNLYIMDAASGAEKMITNVQGGVFYVSAGADSLVYSGFEDGCYNLFKHMKTTDDRRENVPLTYVPQEKPAAGAVKKPQAPPLELFPEKYGSSDDEAFVKSAQEQAKALTLSESAYETVFTPDMVLGLLGFSSDSGFIGGGYLTLSDMLGNHNFSLYANLVPGYYAQFDLSYLYMSLPFDVGFRFFYYQDAYKLYDSSSGEFFSRLDSTEIGGSLSVKYPFGTYSGVAAAINSSRVTDKYSNYQTSSTLLFPENSVNILNTVALYYEYDYSAWRDLWPYSGEYFMAYVEATDRVFGGTRNYAMYELDYRKHFDLSAV
ncbi:MAG TPA: DPP IV N-terminal domain-containing protein, partial [Candidatus Goldiibacteriota bacterium]|nr:DPP IV N-terminal domain-containing protein [Candidatus Goldiibacteriota bacterium]